MMTGSIILATLLYSQSTHALLSRPEVALSRLSNQLRRFLASSTTDNISLEYSISRISTLQSLLSRHGAPGSAGCSSPNDLVPVDSLQDTPELVSLLSGPGELANLHPYLYPIAKSRSSGHYICAYRNPFAEESDRQPWPIVETKLGGPGMSVLALNSEQLMRRIICECDFSGHHEDSVQLYNEGLGMGLLKDSSLDRPYDPGAVAQLGYGVEKYVLLRVGPFPDLYQSMSRAHAERKDEKSSLIAAETTIAKIPNFGSNFRFYARLLKSFPHRDDEARDAARMCLRLPLPTVGLSFEDYKEVATLGQLAEETDSTETAVANLKSMLMKIREVESRDNQSHEKTPTDVAIDEANFLLDTAALEGQGWTSVRPKVAQQFRSIGRFGMANFVDFSGALQ